MCYGVCASVCVNVCAMWHASVERRAGEGVWSPGRGRVAVTEAGVDLAALLGHLLCAPTQAQLVMGFEGAPVGLLCRGQRGSTEDAPLAWEKGGHLVGVPGWGLVSLGVLLAMRTRHRVGGRRATGRSQGPGQELQLFP